MAENNLLDNLTEKQRYLIKTSMLYYLKNIGEFLTKYQDSGENEDLDKAAILEAELMRLYEELFPEREFTTGHA